MSLKSAMFLTTCAEEVKNTEKFTSYQSCISSESVEMTVTLPRPSFSFDAVVSTPNAAKKCPEIDSKGLEIHIRRCRELEAANQQLNERLIETESKNEECKTEIESLKRELAEVLKIPAAMLFPGKTTQVTMKDNVQKLQTLLRPASPQGAFINAQHTTVLTKESSTRTSEALLDSPVSSETSTVHNNSRNCEIEKEDGVSKTQIVNPQGGEDVVKTLRNQAPQNPLHVIESKTPASLRVDINDSARNLADYRCLRSSASFNFRPVAEARLHLDSMTKENSQLRREIIRISEELVDVKEHSVTLEAELKEQRDATVRCKMTEKNLRRVQDSNRDLNNALFRKQKIITSLKTVLTNLISEAKQYSVQNLTPGTRVAPHLNTKICTQVDGVLETERCYSNMERLITAAQTERDCVASRLIALDGQARCLQRKCSRTKSEMDAMQKQNSSLKRALSCARSEIRTLQTNLRVETMKLISRKRTTRCSLDLDTDFVMKELIKTKIALAEMHGVVIKLRKEIFKSRSIGGCSTRSSKTCSSKLRGQY